MDRYKQIWEKYWDFQIGQGLSLLNYNSREAYRCFRRWIDNDNIWILEAGSGSGYLSIQLAKELQNSYIYGVDFLSKAIIYSDKQRLKSGVNNLVFIQADIHDLPFRDCTFDVVFNEGVIEHFRNYERIFNEMVRVVRIGGKIIVSVPNLYYMPHIIYKILKGKHYLCGYEKSFLPSELLNLFRKYNLKYLDMKGFSLLHSLQRFPTLANLLESINFPKFISNRFGMQIAVKGVK